VPDATGEGTAVQVEVDAVRRALASLALAARRHGGVEIGVRVAGSTIELEPVVRSAGPIVLGEELKDLGAAVAVMAVRAGGGEVELDGERLLVTLPTSAS
jgi:hypothetical protein